MGENGRPGQFGHCCCGYEHLTAREIRVLCLVAAGLSNTRISESLHLSSHTIDRHLGNMLRRSSADNRAALVARAYYAGVLVPGIWPPSVSGRTCLPPSQV
jgi:DNA-binding CsgD family transcriptional regulator